MKAFPLPRGTEAPLVTLQPFGGVPPAGQHLLLERIIRLGDRNFETNLPENADIFENPEINLDTTGEQGGSGLDYPLIPSGLDVLAVGGYWIKEAATEPGIQGQYPPGSTEAIRKITVFETEYGTAIDAENFQYRIQLAAGAEKLMTTLGYIIEDGQLVAVPTPKAVQRAAKGYGVEVEFVPDEEQISSERYVKVFADGRYPISTKGESYYQHDIDDDHLTAMVLGGTALRDHLQLAAQAAADYDATAKAIDEYTGWLRYGVDGLSFDSVYSTNPADSTLFVAGRQLGLSNEVSHRLFKTIRNNAREFGMYIGLFDK